MFAHGSIAPHGAASLRRNDFVGRRAPLQALHRAFATVTGGQAHLVLISGDPGIGKTRLVRWFLADIAERAVVLRATGQPDERNRANSVLAQLDVRLHADADAARSDPLQLGTQLLGLLGQHQSRRPVCVIIDDAQWADAASLQALRFTQRRLQYDRVLTIVAHQRDLRGPAILHDVEEGHDGCDGEQGMGKFNAGFADDLPQGQVCQFEMRLPHLEVFASQCGKKAVFVHGRTLRSRARSVQTLDLFHHLFQALLSCKSNVRRPMLSIHGQLTRRVMAQFERAAVRSIRWDHWQQRLRLLQERTDLLKE